MQKRSYTFKNEKNELICVFRLDTFSVGTKTYSVGFLKHVQPNLLVELKDVLIQLKKHNAF